MRSQPFSLARAELEAGEKVAFVFAGEGSVTFRELGRAGALALDGLAPGPLALVAQPNAPSVALLFGALDRNRPVLLLHPRAPRPAQERAARALGAASLWDGARWQAVEASSAAPAPALPPEARILLETSGSTGAPKLVVHSASSLAAAAEASAANLGWAQEGDRWLLSLPLSHVGGLSILLRCFLGRQTAVLAPLPTDDPNEAARQLCALDVTLVSLVPTQLTRLLAAPDFRFPPAVRQVLIGGATLTPELRARAQARAVPLLSTYGMTEFCSQICTEKPGQPGAGVGLPLPGTEVRLTQEGRIQVRGPTACLGYWARASPFDAEGWFTTNDRGAWDERGHLHVLGRTDHMIISGGENVHPEAIEAQLGALPEIAAVGVVGVPDEGWGQRIVAAVVLAPATKQAEFASLTRRWQEELRQRLPRFALPKDYVVLDALPLLGIGKLDRKRLEELVLAALGG